MEGIPRKNRSYRQLRMWLLITGLLVGLGTVTTLGIARLTQPSEDVPRSTVTAGNSPSQAAPTEPELATPPSSTPKSSTGSPAAVPAAGEPWTTDFEAYALAAAQTIYTWDTRTTSYSGVYGNLRSWWHVLPDGSNPLTVLAQEFEATGINAGTYATLAGERAYRTATAQSAVCDEELSQVRDHPAPWQGLHVCTVRVDVTDRAASGNSAYTASVSIMVNCPPAKTTPPDRCALVGFYTTPARIVY